MDDQLRNHTPAENVTLDPSEPDLTALREAKQVVKCLVKFIQGKKLYAKNNPLLTTFSKEIKTAFDNFFRHEDEFVVAIDQYSIQWEGQVIYENSKREESIAFLLYKDGVGELNFQNSLNFEEVEKFSNIIIDEMLRASPEDDVVTKLWKADFDHISYRVLDEYLSGEFGEGDAANASLDPSPLDSDDHAELLPMFRDNGRVVVKDNEDLEPLETYYCTLISRSGVTPDAPEWESTYEEFLETIFQINSEELKLCHEELLEEKRQDGVLLLMEAMLDFVTVSDNPSVMRDVTNIVDRLVEHFIHEKDARILQKALARIREAANDCALRKDIRQYCATLENKLSHSKTLVYLTGDIQQWNKHAEEILNYVASLGSPAVNTLINLLKNAESGRLRNEICDHLVAIVDDNVEKIIDQIGVEKSEFALAAIYLAANADTERIPASIKELIFYPSNRIREEMIKYLAFSRDDEARALLLRMLDDEEKKIRMKALGALEGKRFPEVQEKLHFLAFDKELSKRSHDEQEAIFMILGSVGDDETVSQLRGITGKKNKFFGRKRDNSVLAIRALERIQSPESIRLLEILANDSSPLVKTQAQRALHALRQNSDTADS